MTLSSFFYFFTFFCNLPFWIRKHYQTFGMMVYLSFLSLWWCVLKRHCRCYLLLLLVFKKCEMSFFYYSFVSILQFLQDIQSFALSYLRFRLCFDLLEVYIFQILAKYLVGSLFATNFIKIWNSILIIDFEVFLVTLISTISVVYHYWFNCNYVSQYL
jgi:hypothetical protein